MKKIVLFLFASIYIITNANSQCETNSLSYPINSVQVGTYKTSGSIESAGEIESHVNFMATGGITLKPGFSLAANATFSANNLGCANTPEATTITENSTYEEDQMKLQELLTNIQATAESVLCVNGANWSFIPIGSKACGGPSFYIAYSAQIDEVTFLYDVQRYTTATNDFNIKWGIFSTCDITPAPLSVICQDGEAILSYEAAVIIGENTTFEEDQIALQQLFSSIQATAESVPCIDATEWTFTPYGSKACGGPIGYIAYSAQIDETSFLNDVQAYTTANQDFNVKWNIISTCELLLPPNSVICVNGEAVLSYEATVIIGENTTFEEDQMALQQLLSSIKTTAESVTCANPADWKITPIGSKACGGPSGYIAYPIQINEATFLNEVQKYTAATQDFNIKWGIISTCDITIAPSGVSCVGGKAILDY